MAENYMLEVKKRPWWQWLLGALWLVVEIFLLQNSLASSGELEPLAATIFWVTFFVFLAIGLAVYFLRRNN